MTGFLEYGYSSVNKYGEELCGDNVAMSMDGDYITVVLADGLGSGVKANILSILTSKILCTMVSNNIALEECLETIIQSLPVCKLRGVAYSTFSVIHINREGKGRLIEFDNPQAIFFRNECIDLPREEKIILDKKVYISELELQENDIVLIMSDGVIHAGIGKILNLGWQRPQILAYLNKAIKKNMSATAAACVLTSACNDLYLEQPGDDTTVAAVKLRKKVTVDLMVGPPVDKNSDAFYVARFLEGEGKKVVCGGTSSRIVADYLGKEVKTNINFIDKDVPPTASIEGIDLVTEGVITIRRLLELSERYVNHNDLTPKVFVKQDGASLLAQLLFEEATHINFYVGQSVNIAHQGLPIDTTMKLKLVESLAHNLRRMGKVITVQYD